MNELQMVKKNLTSSGIAYKKDILISYFKKKSLEADWIILLALVCGNAMPSGKLRPIKLIAFPSEQMLRITLQFLENIFIGLKKRENYPQEN